MEQAEPRLFALQGCANCPDMSMRRVPFDELPPQIQDFIVKSGLGWPGAPERTDQERR